MAILRGFPPSNCISPSSPGSGPVPQDQHGKSVVVRIDEIKNEILLSNGLWAYSGSGEYIENYPKIGDEVFWSAGSSSRHKTIYWFRTYPKKLTPDDKPITWVDGLDTPPKFN